MRSRPSRVRLVMTTRPGMTPRMLHRRHESIAADIGGTRHDAGCRIARDALHAADDELLPRRADVDLMSARAQLGDGRGLDARFKLHATIVPQPRARRVDRLLQGEAVIDMLHHDLRLRLADAVAAGR